MSAYLPKVLGRDHAFCYLVFSTVSHPMSRMKPRLVDWLFLHSCGKMLKIYKEKGFVLDHAFRGFST